MMGHNRNVWCPRVDEGRIVHSRTPDVVSDLLKQLTMTSASFKFIGHCHLMANDLTDLQKQCSVTSEALLEQ